MQRVGLTGNGCSANRFASTSPFQTSSPDYAVGGGAHSVCVPARPSRRSRFPDPECDNAVFASNCVFRMPSPLPPSSLKLVARALPLSAAAPGGSMAAQRRWRRAVWKWISTTSCLVGRTQVPDGWQGRHESHALRARRVVPFALRRSAGHRSNRCCAVSMPDRFTHMGSRIGCRNLYRQLGPRISHRHESGADASRLVGTSCAGRGAVPYAA